MAKKKEITIKLNDTRAGDTPTPGDVNIFYGHTLLAGLSENAAARLETENTICTKDIGVEYTKAAPPSADPVVVFTRTSDSSVTCNLTPTQIKNLSDDDRGKAVLISGSGNTKNIFPLVCLNASSDEGDYIYAYNFIRNMLHVSASLTRINWSSITCTTYGNTITYNEYVLNIATT